MRYDCHALEPVSEATATELLINVRCEMEESTT